MGQDIRPVWLDGWADYSTWGFDAQTERWYCQLYRDASGGNDAPLETVCAVDPPRLAAEITRVTGYPTPEVIDMFGDERNASFGSKSWRPGVDPEPSAAGKAACVVPTSGPARAVWIQSAAEIRTAIGSTRIDKTVFDLTEAWAIYAWVGDNSLNDGSPPNLRVTEELNRLRERRGEGQYPVPLCGTVVLAAFDRHNGEDIDLPEQWRRAIGPSGRLRWIT